MPLSVSLSELVGFACEAVLWGTPACSLTHRQLTETIVSAGIYVVLFGISIILLFRRGKGRYLNLPVTATSCFLFSLCTTHFGLEFSHYVSQMVSLQVDVSLDSANIPPPSRRATYWAMPLQHHPLSEQTSSFLSQTSSAM